MKLISQPLSNFNPPPLCLELLEEVNKNYGMIGGGAARQLYLNDGSYGSTDIDLYFPSKEYSTNFIHFFSGIKSIKTKAVYGNAAKTWDTKFGKIQIVYKNTFHPKHLFSEFDFHCCCFAVFDNNLYYTQEAIDDVRDKKLRLNYADRVQNFRIIKYYLKYGYDLADDSLKERFDYCFKQFLNTPGSSEKQIEDFITKGHTYEPYKDIFEDVPQPQLDPIDYDAIAGQRMEPLARYLEANARWDRPDPRGNPQEYAAQAQIQAHFNYQNNMNNGLIQQGRGILNPFLNAPVQQAFAGEAQAAPQDVAQVHYGPGPHYVPLDQVIRNNPNDINQLIQEQERNNNNE